MGLYFLRPEFPTAEMKSPKVYFSIDIKFVGAITKKNTRKINTLQKNITDDNVKLLEDKLNQLQ